MDTTNQDFKELIYDLMRGTYDLQEYTIKESQYVDNEFGNGKFCTQAYEQIFNANKSICNRLGENEDKDVECIISNFFDIMHHLCIKMYDYGALYSYRNTDTKKLVRFYHALPERKKIKFMDLLNSLHTLLNHNEADS